MSLGIKYQLDALIGEKVDFVQDSNSGVCQIQYPPANPNSGTRLLRIVDDCVVLEGKGYEMFLSIYHISSLIIKKT